MICKITFRDERLEIDNLVVDMRRVNVEVNNWGVNVFDPSCNMDYTFPYSVIEKIEIVREEA